MNRFIPIFICIIFLVSQGKSQGNFGYENDTFLVNSGSNRMLAFGNESNDKRIPINRVFLPVTEFHSSPTLFPDFVYFDPLENLKFTANENPSMGNPDLAFPTSLIMYLDTTGMQIDYKGRLILQNIPSKAVQHYVQPFYFSKYEVSNKDYHEFVDWVSDSIAHVRLNYLSKDGKIDWAKKIDWADSNLQNKTGMFLKVETHYYKGHQLNSKVLVYHFKNSPSEYGSDTLNIYPDTLSWVHDFNYAYNEPMTNMYYWHPAYNDYPVVGINYWQCLAFLEWKSNQMNQLLVKQGNKIHVECKLPSAAEWDYVSTAMNKEGKTKLLTWNYDALCDHTWLTDLRLCSYPAINIPSTQAYNKDSTKSVLNAVQANDKPITYSPFMNEEDFLLRGNDVILGDFTTDGYFQTAPVNPNRKRKEYYSKSFYREQKTNARFLAHTDQATGICYLDGNVSEWMRNDLDSSWRAVFSKHVSRITDPTISEAAKIALETENYYFKKLPTHGKLVRGGNWMDERYNNNYGKNTAGMNAKTFEDPSKDHCTLGFRYVIYVYPN